MTAERPHEQPSNDPFEVLREGAIDPVLADAMGNAEEAQAELQGRELNWKIVHEVLANTNELWESSEYVGALGRFSGKLRESYRGAKNDTITARLLEKLPKGTDEYGEYWLAHNVPLVSSHFTVATDEENLIDADGRVGLSLIPPEAYIDDYMDAGALLLYLDEIESAEYPRPNAATIEKQLAYHFPALYRELQRLLPEGVDPSEAKIVEFMHHYSALADESLYHNYPIADRLGAYITSRLEFDDAKYEIGIHGPIYAIDEYDEEVAVVDKKHHNYTIRAKVACVIMRRDDEPIDGIELYRPCLVLGVDEPGKNSGYSSYIVPPESLVRLKSERRENRRFGNQVLQSFANVAEIREFFAPPPYGYDDESDKSADNDQFAAIIQDFKHEMPQMLGYNQQHNSYEISVARDMTAVVAKFTQLLEKYGKRYPDRALAEADYAEIDKQMGATYDHLQDLLVGSKLATRGDIFFMDLRPDGGSQPVSLHGTYSLHGNFLRFDIIEHPTIVLLPGVGLRMVNGGTVASICAVLTDCKVVDGNDVDQKHEFGTEEILVPVIASNTDRFIKLEQLDGETDERA